MHEEKPISIVLLMSGLLSASIILAAGEAILRYGAFGGLFLSMTVPIAYVFIVLLTRNIHENQLFDRIQYLLTSGHRIWFVWIIYLLWIEFMITQSITAGFILKTLFSTSFTTSTIIVFIVYFLLSFILKLLNRAGQPGFLKIFLLFSLAIFLPNYIYLQKGLETVYHNLIHYHPRVIHLEQPGIYIFFVAGVIIMFTKLLIYIVFLGKGLSHRKKNGLRKIGLVSISWSTVVMAFSTMTIVAITEKIRGQYVNEQMVLLIEQVSSPAIFIVVSVIWLIISFVTFFHAFQNIGILWDMYPVSLRIRSWVVQMTESVVAMGLLLLILKFELSILEIIFLFGVLYGPVGILLSYIYRRGYESAKIWLFLLAGVSVSVVYQINQPQTSLPLIVIIASFATLLFHSLFKIVKKI